MKGRASVGARRAALLLATSLTLAAWSSPCAAQSTDAGAQSRYHLFHRAPRSVMRELATDRPDTTESPITVDAGHFQLEVELATLERDEGATALTLGSLNFKLGLASWTDLQVLFDLLHRTGGENDVGDLTFRNKINLWGNDGGPTALGLMPFVTLPTSRLGPGYTEGGLIVPLALEGPAGWDFAVMVEFDVVRRERAYGMDLVTSATTGHAIWEPLSGFVELASVTPLASEPVEVTANAGLLLALSDDLMLDGGVRCGLTDAAPDVAAFVGGSARY